MKKVLSLLAIAMFAFPAFAQDDVILTGGDIDALMGGGNRNNNRGGRGNNNNQPQIPDPIFFFEDVKALLKNNKVPLDKNQEKALQTFLNSETTKMRTDLEAQFQNRGGNRGNANQNNDITRLTAIGTGVEKHNAALLNEVKAALLPDQASLVDKGAKDKKICSVMLDMINFEQLRQRFNNNNNNFNRGGGFNDGGIDLSALGLDFPQAGGGNRGNTNNFQNQLANIIPNRPSCTSKESTTDQRVAVLGDILTKGKKPLTADQQTKVAALVDGKLKTMMDELKASDQQMERFITDFSNQTRNNNQNQNQQNQTPQTPQVNVQTLTNNIVNTIMQNLGVQNSNNNNNNNNNRGGRGGNANNNAAANNAAANNAAANNAAANANNQNRGNNNQNFQNFNPQAEIQKKSEELFDKVAAMLKPEQGTFVKKVKYDQIKARGPVDKYRGILEQEGTPATPEQLTQIQQLLNATNQAVRTFAQGLVTTEIQALEPGALQAAAQQIIQQQAQQAQQSQNPQQNRGNPNVNNVNQNGVAQQIVSKVISQVSVQRARLDKIASDQILTRVLTPAQQASYKVANMN